MSSSADDPVTFNTSVVDVRPRAEPVPVDRHWWTAAEIKLAWAERRYEDIEAARAAGQLVAAMNHWLGYGP